MISIGITVCDNDFRCCSALLKQIEQKVTVEHEVIIIDNREKFIEEKTEWKPAYAFGYNAFQFSARAKIIELAKGDYIWFIDGDDNICELTEEYDEDIVAFSFCTYPVGIVHISDGLYEKDLFTYEMSLKIFPVLWNKIIKKKLFSDSFIDKYRNLKIVTNEDVLWCYEALSHAESVRTVDKIIYEHTEGLSNKQNSFSNKDFDRLVIGFNDMRTVLKTIINNCEFFTKSIHSTYVHIMSFIPQSEDLRYALELMMKIVPKDEFRKILINNVYPRVNSPKQFKQVIDIVSENYGTEFPFEEVTCKVTYYGGRTEDCTFKQTIDFN